MEYSRAELTSLGSFATLTLGGGGSIPDHWEHSDGPKVKKLKD